jgi:hypothetical protein
MKRKQKQNSVHSFINPVEILINHYMLLKRKN